MPDIGSAISGVGAVSGLIGGSKASKAQAQAAQAANEVQMHMFDTTQENLKPYMETGKAANNALMSLTGLGGGAGGYDTAAYDQALKAWEGVAGGSPATTPEGLPLNSAAATNGFVRYPDGSLTYNGRPVFQAGKGGYHLMDTGEPVPTVGMIDGPLGPVPIAASSSLAGTTPTGTRGEMPKLSDFALPGSAQDVLSSPLLKAITMDQATLEKTPGYQFNLTQGLKSVQNAAAARGLGSSGAALKGASQYATGLADSTYQNQFSNAVTNQTNQFNRLYSMANSGQNAAAGLGGIGQQTASNIGNNLVGAANTQAAATMAGFGGIGNAANAYGQNQALQGLYQGNANNSWYAGNRPTQMSGFMQYGGYGPFQ